MDIELVVCIATKLITRNKMDDISIFQDKTITPTDNDLVEKLDSTYDLWVLLQDFVLSKYPNGLSELNY